MLPGQDHRTFVDEYGAMLEWVLIGQNRRNSEEYEKYLFQCQFNRSECHCKSPLSGLLATRWVAGT